MNINKIREDFPFLQKLENNKPFIYFDNSCTTLKPIQVIDACSSYYKEFCGCHGRSAHKIGKIVTDKLEESRKKVAKFINADENELIFTKNCTESINLVASSIDLKKDDIVVNSDREHSSNIIPWLILRDKIGLKRIYIPSTSEEKFDLEKFKQEMNTKVKLVSIVHTSNLDGYTLPVKEIIKISHECGSLVLIDGAQSTPHRKIDVKNLDADFFAFSAHKMLGPTGVGCLYGKGHLLEKLNPFITGGSTVFNSTYDSYQMEKHPKKFEAGIQNYSGVIGFAATIDYLNKIGMDNIHAHELELTKYLQEKIPSEVEIVGVKNPEERSGITSFSIPGIDNHEVALMLDEMDNILTRSGQHCLHSWFNARQIKGSVRASLYIYNTKQEIDIFIEAIKKIIQLR